MEIEGPRDASAVLGTRRSAHQLGGAQRGQGNVERMAMERLVEAESLELDHGLARSPAAHVKLLAHRDHARLEGQDIGEVVDRKRAERRGRDQAHGLARAQIVEEGAHLGRRELADHALRGGVRTSGGAPGRWGDGRPGDHRHGRNQGKGKKKSDQRLASFGSPPARARLAGEARSIVIVWYDGIAGKR